MCEFVPSSNPESNVIDSLVKSTREFVPSNNPESNVIDSLVDNSKLLANPFAISLIVNRLNRL